MVIDKKLDLDKELEYFGDGGLAFAQNVVVSQDGLTIQNEPAIVNFLSIENITIVGFIACNEEFVIFATKLNDNNKPTIYRVKKDSSYEECITNWSWCGGEVFGTFTYNVNNELIIAISERNLKEGIDCPLKIINLDRDKYVEGSNDDIYTLTPDIPKSNLLDIEYINGNKIKKGKYNLFIKYFIDDDFETSWFPIGIPIFVYDNINSDVIKNISDENIQSTSMYEEGGTSSSGIPAYVKNYKVNYNDYYNENNEYTNVNIKLFLSINDVNKYTNYKIGYIINTSDSIEAKSTYKFNISSKEIVLNDNHETISVDDITQNVFNIYNVNTLCNYKNRLYLANYKEENRNSIVDKIDISSIKVWFNNETSDIPIIENDDYSSLRNQWKSKPGRAAIYNFFIHYVYPNGNYTDGIKIGTLDKYAGNLYLGESEITTEETTVSIKQYYYPDKDTSTNSILAKLNDGSISNDKNTELEDFLNNNLDVLWWTVEAKFYKEHPKQFVDKEIIEGKSNALQTIVNSKGDVLYCTPTNYPVNVNKLIFTGIKMYPEFVGYFISYEEPQYIQIGEGFIIPEQYEEKVENEGENTTNSTNITAYDLFDLDSFAEETDKWKFYYPEFSIVGGKTNINRLIISGTILKSNIKGNDNLYVEGDNFFDGFKIIPKVTGLEFQFNDFNSKLAVPNYYNSLINVQSSAIISPNYYNNIGKEAYLQIKLNKKIIHANNGTVIPIHSAISDDRNLYLSDDKKLVSLGYIKYINYDKNNPDASYLYGDDEALYNYDFYRCYSSIIFFTKFGVIINNTESNPINAITGTQFYPFKDIANKLNPHIGIIKYWHETHYPLFLKEINEAPEVIFRNYYAEEFIDIFRNRATAEQIQKKNLIISPQSVNSLYKLNPAYYEYTGKLLVNYDENLVSNKINYYNKTVRRSDVIQSESIVNSWRYFRPENYKIITEDKGAINNVVGIGNYLFAHCEHSLFLFDISDSLQTLDKNVQLLQPDSFEVAYKEVFTADKGYGGLQDYVSWICDEFGYIFFDKSAQKIYRFDGGQLKDMTEGIDSFIKVVQPNEIWFGNDRPHSRIMLNVRSADDAVILSYSLLGGSWISTHSYISNNKFIGLKDKLFIPNVDGNNVTINHYIDTEFNKFSLPVGSIDNNDSAKSFIDVVFTNPNYNKIKVLDFITYILNKEPADNFELLQIEIYTNCCYSGVIDIREERKRVTDYKKPYYDYERWNFNYFRNVIDKIENGDVVDRLTGFVRSHPQKVKRGYDNALISGKYVVIRFSFKLMSKQVNVKDIHAYFKP